MGWTMKDMRKGTILMREGKDNDFHTLFKFLSLHGLEKAGLSDHLAIVLSRTSQESSPEPL